MGLKFLYFEEKTSSFVERFYHANQKDIGKLETYNSLLQKLYVSIS